MKQLTRFTKWSFFLLLAAVILGSCVKKDNFYDKTTTETNRKGIVQIQNAPFLQLAKDALPIIDTFLLIDIRRYPNTQEDLNQAQTVKLVSKPSLITAYNTANSTNFIELPASSYTLLGDIGNITFAAGEAIKEIKIRLDKSSLNLSNQYALAFSITDVGASNSVANPDMQDIIYTIIVKNKYDGVYSLKGVHNRSPYNYPFLATMDLITKDANSVALFWEDAGDYGQPIGTGPDPVNDASWYGNAIAPVFTFNQSTNLITNIYNGGSATPIVMYTGTGAPTSRYDPVTKTIYAYFYYYTAAGQDFSNRGWSDTLTYIKAR